MNGCSAIVVIFLATCLSVSVWDLFSKQPKARSLCVWQHTYALKSKDFLLDTPEFLRLRTSSRHFLVLIMNSLDIDESFLLVLRETPKTYETH